MSSVWCENTSKLPQAVSGLPLTWGGGAIWIGVLAVTSFLSFMLITHLSGTLTHRFFAHRCFCTSRGFTWILYAFCSLQTPPIWWSSIHRRHHRQPDSDTDPHPPQKVSQHTSSGTHIMICTDQVNISCKHIIHYEQYTYFICISHVFTNKY